MAVPRFSARIVAALGMALISAACGATSSSPPDPQGGASDRTSLSAAERPDWHPGDRWTYEWTSGTARGTKTAEVVDIREINGVRYYILRVGDVDHYYTVDFRWAAAVRDGKVEVRMSPPQPWFVWPLGAGRRWVHEGTWEDRDGKRATRDVFSVGSMETVEVPAGRFSAVKVIRDGGSGVSDEYWYVPAIRSYARWSGRRNEVTFDERLTAYHPSGRSTSSPLPPSASPPSR